MGRRRSTCSRTKRALVMRAMTPRWHHPRGLIFPGSTYAQPPVRTPMPPVYLLWPTSLVMPLLDGCISDGIIVRRSSLCVLYVQNTEMPLLIFFSGGGAGTRKPLRISVFVFIYL